MKTPIKHKLQMKRGSKMFDTDNVAGNIKNARTGCHQKGVAEAHKTIEEQCGLL